MLSWEQIQTHCLAQKCAAEDFPFGDDVPVYKVKGKMFALVAASPNLRITLKCDPYKAEMLRDMYPAVQAGYHMNKRHWNTITIDGSIADDELLAMIDDSYQLVVKGLKQAEREQL
ncbi:MAG: MmcQ/YjbR family DNA-binding protein [Chloroflexaceae bacterium]|nr:MmcQ/YjbR family DNA-binding protein [Chloroflexaceae bacterium]